MANIAKKNLHSLTNYNGNIKEKLATELINKSIQTKET